MKLEEIKAAVLAGKTVHWATASYVVIVDKIGQWFIHCPSNRNYIGLTHVDRVTMNGQEKDFYVAAKDAPDDVIECAYCEKRVWFRDTYSPGDEAICAECDTEATGRQHPPSLNPDTEPPPPIR